MPGFYETVIADAIRSGGTIYLPAALGTTILATGDQKTLASEAHTAASTGPATAGWGVSGGGKSKAFDLLALYPGFLPSNVKNVMVKLRLTLKNTDSAIPHTMTLSVTNLANTAINAYLSEQAYPVGGTTTFTDLQEFFLIPVTAAAQSLLVFCQWPNTVGAQPNTLIQVVVVGYET